MIRITTESDGYPGLGREQLPLLLQLIIQGLRGRPSRDFFPSDFHFRQSLLFLHLNQTSKCCCCCYQKELAARGSCKLLQGILLKKCCMGICRACTGSRRRTRGIRTRPCRIEGSRCSWRPAQPSCKRKTCTFKSTVRSFSSSSSVATSLQL